MLLKEAGERKKEGKSEGKKMGGKRWQVFSERVAVRVLIQQDGGARRVTREQLEQTGGV